MSTSTQLAGAETPRSTSVAEHRESGWAILDALPGSRAERFAAALGGRHPVLVFFAALLTCFALAAALSIGVGWLVTHLLLHIGGVSSADESVNTWLYEHRGGTATDASKVGSTLGGAPLLPILVGLIALVCAALRRWRLAAFAVFVLAVESGLYRVTTLVIHRHRPSVPRLESLPVNASYPSGHTAATIAVYAGLALLVSSRVRDRTARIAIWAFAGGMVVFVAASRLYRGMHHPIDVLAAVGVGIAAIAILLFACRAAGAAAERRVQRRA